MAACSAQTMAAAKDYMRHPCLLLAADRAICHTLGALFLFNTAALHTVHTCRAVVEDVVHATALQAIKKQ